MDRRTFFETVAIAMTQAGMSLKTSGAAEPQQPGIEVVLRFGTLTALVQPIPPEHKKIGEPDDFEFNTGNRWDRLHRQVIKGRGWVRVSCMILPETIWDEVLRQYTGIIAKDRLPVTLEIRGMMGLPGEYKAVFDHVVIDGYSMSAAGDGIAVVKHLSMSGQYRE